LRIYVFEATGREIVIEATTLHTALYRLGLELEKNGKWGVGSVHNYKLCVLKRIFQKTKPELIEYPLGSEQG